jgi:hypothetical protein
MRAQAKRLHGENSEQSVQVEQAFRDAHSGSLAYQVVYELRNVMTHYSMESVEMSLRGYLQDPDDRNSARYEAEIYVIRSILTRDSVNVGAALRRAVDDLEEDPDFMMLAEDALKALERAHDCIYSTVHPELASDMSNIQELDRLFAGRSGHRALAEVYSNSSGMPQFPHKLIPSYIFDFVKGGQ